MLSSKPRSEVSVDHWNDFVFNNVVAEPDTEYFPDKAAVYRTVLRIALIDV